MSNTNQDTWELISGKLHDELGEEEKEKFEAWSNAPENQKLLQKGQSIKDGLFESRKLKKVDKQKSWNRVEKLVRKQKFTIYFKRTLQYAAVLVFAFLVGNFFSPIFEAANNNQYTQVEVMYGQTSHLFLFDGTEVWLNAGTTFTYPKNFNSGSRDVSIEGEAFFKVAPNKHLPFKVKTSKMEVEVLGTSFNVAAYRGEENHSVVLVEGKVQINNLKGRKIGEIAPGQIAVQSSRKPLTVANTDPYFYTSWKDGKVAFNGEKISDIAMRLERWYNVEIQFEKESLKEYDLTGTILLNKPIEQTIMALELLAPIKFETKEIANGRTLITVISK